MAINDYKYDESYIPEIYDQWEDHTEDVQFLRRLIGARLGLTIFEPFCGNGRILIPLAQDGHALVGLDIAQAMLDSLRKKVSVCTVDVQQRVTLILGDAVNDEWPTGFDLVILGGNCLYELATPEEQEACIVSAATAVKPGGYVYVDNNHMEGELDVDWRQPGINTGRFPSGICSDGTRVDGTGETIWFDAPRRLWRTRNRVTVTFPDGSIQTTERVIQNHPVSTYEVRDWLQTHGFIIESLYGDRQGNPYTDESPRAIFWARKV